MTPPKPVFNEDILSEQATIAQLKKLGYDYFNGDELDSELKKCERSSRREVVLVATRINPSGLLV